MFLNLKRNSALFALLLVFACSNSYSQVIKWSTYLNTIDGDNMLGMTKDNAGNIYVLGNTFANGFPVTAGAFQAGLGNAISKLTVSKINAATGSLVWSTYLGGDDKTQSGRLYWDSASNTICVSALSSSTDYPVVGGNPKTSTAAIAAVFSQFSASGAMLFSTYVFEGDVIFQNYRTIFDKGFVYYLTSDVTSTKLHVSKINLATSQFTYQKRVGGTNGTFNYYSAGFAPLLMTINNGEAYLSGSTSATDYPTTAGAYQTIYPAGAQKACFITKLDAVGNIGFSTFVEEIAEDYAIFVPPVAIGGNELATVGVYKDGLQVSPGGIAFDNVEDLNLGIMKLDKNTGALLYFTYFGGNSDLYTARAIRYVGKELIINGNSQDPYLPVTANAIQRFNSYTIYDGNYGGDCYIAHLDSANRIVYCSYMGGNRSENFSNSIVSGNDIYFYGSTSSNNFPVTPNATQPVFKGVASDLLFVKYNVASRSVTYSSFLGTNGLDNIAGTPVIIGPDIYLLTNSYNYASYYITNDYPVTPDAFQKSVIGSVIPSNHQYLAKINSLNGKMSYASYIGSTLTGLGETANSMVVDGNSVFVAGTSGANDYPVTVGALQTTSLGSNDMYVTKISLCESDITSDTLMPKSLAVCANSLLTAITGSVPQFGNAPAIIRNGVTSAQPVVPNLTYLWQLSTDSITWTNISGAIAKDYTPTPIDRKTYFRRIAKSASCSNTSTSSVTTINLNGFIANKPDVGSGGIFFSCPNSNLTLGTTPVPGVVYSWQPTTNLSGANTAQPVFNNAVAGAYTYVLFATDANGCTAMDTATVFNYKANAGANKVMCPDKSTQIGSAPLAGLAGVTYNWTPSTGLSCSTCPQPIVNRIGTYVLTVNVPLPSGGNCITTDTVIVDNGTTLINPAGADQTICNNEIITLGTPRVAGYTYNWTPGVFLSGVADVAQPTFNQMNASINLIYNPINYILTATNPSGCTVVDTAKVFVVDVHAGYITCRPSRLGKKDYTRGDATYEWVDVTTGVETPVGPGELSSTTISNPVALANATITDKTYRLKMTWNGVTCYEDVLVITTCGGCPGVDIKFTSKSGCPNVVNTDSVKMFINLPDPGYTYSWSPSIGLNKTSGYEVMTGVTTSTEYTVTATSIVDTSLHCSNTIKINFFLPSAPAFSAPDKIICKDATSNIGLPAVTGLDYMWTNDHNFGAVVSVDADPIITGVQTSNYYVKVTDPASGCYVNDTIFVTVPVVPVNAGPSRPSCTNGGFTIGSPGIAGLQYNWFPFTGLSNPNVPEPTVVSNTADIEYVLQVTDPASGCSVLDTVVITHTNNPTLEPIPSPAPYCQGSNSTVQIGTPALNGVTYSWSPTTGLSDPSIAQPIASPDVTTTYTVTASFSGSCATVATENVTVFVTPAPTATATVVDNCGSSQLSVTTNAALPTYSWSPPTALSSVNIANPVSTTNVPVTYEVIVADQGSGCRSTATVNVVPPVVADAGENAQICEGTIATIGTPAVGGVVYSWTPTTGLNSYNIAEPTTLNSLGAGTYTYTVSATSGPCTKMDTVVIKVNAAPIMNLTAGVTICKNASVQIGVAPESTNSYSWTPPTGLSDEFVANPVASPLLTTTYTLTATNLVTGCSATGTTTVTVNNTAAPIVSTRDTTVCKGFSAQLNADVTGTGTYNYVWIPDVDFVTSRFIKNPIVAPTANTTYSVLVTDNIDGCSNTAASTVAIVDTCNTLPLTWLAFTAVLNNGKTNLHWSVGMEHNNKKFVVQRSVDGVIWSNFLSIDSRGNTNIGWSYNAIDPMPFNGLTYYRIQQVDNDGKSTYSIVRMVKTTKDASSFVVYPNPTHDMLHYELKNDGSSINADLQLLTAEGRLVMRKQISNNSGTISLKALPAGMYIIRIIDKSGKVENKKVILQK